MRLAVLSTVPVLSRMWCHPPQSLPSRCPSYLSHPSLACRRASRLQLFLRKPRTQLLSSSPLGAVPTLPPGSRCKGTAVGVARGPVGNRAEPARRENGARELSKWQDCGVSRIIREGKVSLPGPVTNTQNLPNPCSAVLQPRPLRPGS